jgi:Reverse transcriptase (RNA-dependent DNA polymerase)
MPFGLTNATSTFQAVINDVFREYLDEFIMVYINYILIFSRTAEDHLRHVELILARLRQHQLFEKLSKCEFNRASLPFLGHVVGQGGVEMQHSKVQALADWPRLTKVTEVQSFLGLAKYYCGTRTYVGGRGEGETVCKSKGNKGNTRTVTIVAH